MQLLRPAALTVLSVSCLLAQDYRASITGSVTDPTGAPIPNAQVLVRSTTRNTSAEAVTNEAGLYLVQFLLPDQYSLTVEKSGFKKFVRDGLKLQASDRLGLDVRLEVGQVADSITVTGETQQLQTETATRLATIEQKFIDNIPTSGRNLFQFQYTLPGVYKASNYWGDFELYAFGNIDGVSINGGRRQENETLIDGLPTTTMTRSVAYVPALQSVQEVSIVSNIYDAQYGRVGGGVTSINLKSGTNRLHGQVFHFLENEALYASPWTSNALGLRKTPFKQNVPGFGVDGPVYIPKVFDGRNKLFFMLSLEALRERNPGLQERRMPTAAEKGGDFSALRTNAGQAITIHDPLNAYQPFAGNRIPSSRINPVTAKVASFYPDPNRPPVTLDGGGNYVVVTPARNGYDSWNGKMDFRPTAKSGYSFRYAQTPWSNFARILWGTNAAEPSTEAPSTRVSRTWAADMTHTLSPTMVFSLRAGLARYESFGGNVYGGGFDPRQLGLPDRLVNQFTALQFPAFRFAAYSEIGADRVTSYSTNDNYSLLPSLNWIHGRHSLKVGGDFRRYNRNTLNPASASGTFTFDRRWTQRDPQRGDALSGNDFASFLLGLPSAGGVDRNIDSAYRNHYFGWFLQDDWKITPTFTLNVGLRWDYETPVVERFNRQIRGFDFTSASPIASGVQGLTLKGGLQFAGAGGNPRGAFNPDKNNFQPRVGIAWQVRPKWVLRGGYGLSYLGQSANGSDAGFSRRTALIATTDNVTPAVTMSDPFPASLFPTGLLLPIGNSQGLATNLGLGVGAQYLDRVLPLSHQFSLGVQRELAWGFLVDGSYSANFTRKLPVGMGLNFIPSAELERLPVDQRTAYFNAQVPNPMAGRLPGSAFNGATVPRSQLLYAYPQFANVSISDVPIGTTRYDSLQLKATRRYSSGLAMQIAYTLSKSTERVNLLNAQDANPSNLLATPLEKRLVEFDTPQNLAVVTTYELPVGKGRPFGSALHPVLNGFIGNWNVNAQYVYRSGLLFEFPNARNLAPRSAKFTHAQRDSLASQKGRTQFDPIFDVFFDTALFPNQRLAPFTLRDFSTRFADVRSKALNVWEFGITKDFVLSVEKGVRFQLRADAQNAFNMPWFSRIQSVDVANTRFGYLNSSPRTEAREIILAAKLLF